MQKRLQHEVRVPPILASRGPRLLFVAGDPIDQLPRGLCLALTAADQTAVKATVLHRAAGHRSGRDAALGGVGLDGLDEGCSVHGTIRDKSPPCVKGLLSPFCAPHLALIEHPCRRRSEKPCWSMSKLVTP